MLTTTDEKKVTLRLTVPVIADMRRQAILDRISMSAWIEGLIRQKLYGKPVETPEGARRDANV